jgi:hypothetical protein
MEKRLKPPAQYWAENWTVAYISAGPVAYYGGPERVGGSQGNGLSGPATGRVGVPACAQACGHHGRRSGAGGTGSPLGEMELGVRDEHHWGGGHSPGNARERAA